MAVEKYHHAHLELFPKDHNHMAAITFRTRSSDVRLPCSRKMIYRAPVLCQHVLLTTV